MFKFYQATIGKKAVMAVTGLGLFLFIVAHMIGNLKIFQGIDATSGRYKIDLYSEFLRTVGFPVFGHGELLWIARLGLLALVFLHILSAISVTLANRKARPIAYQKQEYLVTTYAARTMWIGGAILALYVVYHVLHITTGTLHHQGFQEGKVYANLVSTFRVWPIALLYAIAMGALCLHIYHGLWSAFQTLGWNLPKWNKILRNFSKLTALVIFLGYLSVPLAILFGCIPNP